MLAETETLKADLEKATTDGERQRITDALLHCPTGSTTRGSPAILTWGHQCCFIIPALPSPAPVMTGKFLNTARLCYLGLAARRCWLFIYIRSVLSILAPLQMRGVQITGGIGKKNNLSRCDFFEELRQNYLLAGM
jgi:hypothetical protein